MATVRYTTWFTLRTSHGQTDGLTGDALAFCVMPMESLRQYIYTALMVGDGRVRYEK